MRGASIILILFPLLACSPEAAVSLNESISKSNHFIVNGTRSPQTLELTDGEKLAIGFLTDVDGDNYCTGTLITSRLVVTAEHCVDDRFASETFFGIGEQPHDPRAMIPVSEIRLHPTIDFAVLILGLDVSQVIPEAEYLDLNRDLFKDTWVGEWVDAAGFGDTYSFETGLFFAKVEIVEYAEDMVTVDGHGEQGICYGDSGGPILWQKNEWSRPVIVGTEQWGDSSCVDQDHLARIDRVLDFVDSIMVEELPPLLEECNGVPEIGVCGDGIRSWCSGGYQHIENCAEQGKACGWRGDRIGFACLPESCGELDYYGQCDGDLLEWCGTRGFRSKDCAAQGLECVFESEEIGYNCGGCTQCGGECVDYASSVEHCGGCGQTCGPANAIGSCEDAACYIAICLPGFVDADGLVENGCELPIETTDFTLKESSYAGCASVGGTSPQAMAQWLVGLLGVFFIRRKRF